MSVPVAVPSGGRSWREYIGNRVRALRLACNRSSDTVHSLLGGNVLRLPVLLLVLVLEVSGQTSREQILTSALQQDPQNIDKVLQLAAFKLQAASGVTNEHDRAASLDEVQILYLRANSLDPRNVDALYHLGMVSWMKVFPAVVSAR